MSSSSRCCRLSLSSVGSPDPTGDRERKRVVLKHGLSLSEDEIEAFDGALPLELALGRSEETQHARLQQNLRAIGVESRVEPLLVNFETCTKHPKLATDQTCGRCSARTCGACTNLSAERVCAKCARALARSRSFKRFRVAILLFILIVVALGSYLQKRRITSWRQPLRVGVYPIAENEAVEGYIQGLSDAHFAAVERFMQQQGERFERTGSLVQMHLGPAVQERPPELPERAIGPLDAILFSLKLRWWTFQAARTYSLGPADIRLFVIYHEARPGRSLRHSLGLEKGRVGVVYAFGHEKLTARNNVVITHELLHTVGASDKYREDGAAIYPDGFAEPQLPSRYPQTRAEIMAGVIPMSPTHAKLAQSLEVCTVGEKTAREIGWQKSP